MTTRIITGHTRVAAVLGDPVRHSLSPVIHNAGFASLDVDWTYVALPTTTDRLPHVLTLLRGGAIAGASVTMPLKTHAFESMDDLSPSARVLRSVNTISVDDGKLTGHSTDGDGLVDSLEDEDVSLAGASVLILGWGGAARSVADAVARSGARDIVVTNRSGLDSTEVAGIAPVASVVSWSDRNPVAARSDVVINCTSVGMAGHDASPIDVAAITSRSVIVDLVYHPLETPLMAAARDIGCRVVGGLGMLVHQAARQQEIWIGRRPDPSNMKSAALQALAERR